MHPMSNATPLALSPCISALFLTNIINYKLPIYCKLQRPLLSKEKLIIKPSSCMF